MKSSAPLIGFDRYVHIDWCRAALEVAVEKISPDQLRELVAAELPGAESQRKTTDILKRLSTKPFPTSIDFIGRGLEIYKKMGNQCVLAVSWGSAIASYPFFGKTAEISGRLLSLQGDCSIKEIQRRMAETYGDRNGVERAVARVLQSQASWGVLERDNVAKRILKIEPKMIDNAELTAWLIEAAVRYTGRPISVPSLHSLPVLFPFTFSQSLSYLISSSPSLDLRSEGLSHQFVGLQSRL